MVKNVFLVNPGIKKPTLKALRMEARDNRHIKLSINGNKKLKNNSELHFIIWNIPALRTCPFATAHCKQSCYAIKAETAYPNTKKQRAENFASTMRPDFIDNMIYALNVEISRNEIKGIKTLVRIHESGDFYNQKYFDSWLEICRAFVGRDVLFMAYTKSVNYVYERRNELPTNLFLRYSLWDDTDTKQFEIAKMLKLPIYTALQKDIADVLINKGIYTLCRCEDCATCGQCWDKKYNNLVCYIH